MIEKIKAGPFIYRVVEVEDLHDFDNNQRVNLWGHIKHSDLVIEVRKDLAADRKVQVLWHEILHGILEQANQPENEKVIDALATGVMQLLRDNPNLIRTTTEAFDA